MRSWSVSSLPPTLVSSRVLQCAQYPSHCSVDSLRGTNGRVTLFRRTLHTGSVVASRLSFATDEAHTHILISTQQRLGVRTSPCVQHCQGGSHEGIARGLRGDHRCCLTLRFNRVEYDPPKNREMHATQLEHVVTLHALRSTVAV